MSIHPLLSFRFPLSRSTTTKPPSTKPDADLTPDPGGSDSTPPPTDTDYSTAQTSAQTSPVRTTGTESVDRTTRVSSTPKPGTRRQTTLPPEEQTKFFTTPTEFTTTTTYEAEVTTYSSDGTAEKRTCREEEPKLTITDDDLLLLEEGKKESLRSLCWETMFGQELTKMTVMDLMTTAFGIIVGDFLRAVIVRYETFEHHNHTSLQLALHGRVRSPLSPCTRRCCCCEGYLTMCLFAGT